MMRFASLAAIAAAILVPISAYAQDGGQRGGIHAENRRMLDAEAERDKAEREAYAAGPDIRGTGPFAAMKEIDPSLPSHVIYRPADLKAAAAKEKLGVLLWGNGGCRADGASARWHLYEIA